MGKFFQFKNMMKFPRNILTISDFAAYISIDKIDFILRHRKDGDKIHPLGSRGSQKLKNT